jgi:hypothetical protein
MLLFKFVLLAGGIGIMLLAVGVLVADFLDAVRRSKRDASAEVLPAPAPVRWRLAGRLALVGVVPTLMGLAITVVPSGHAGVRVSQLSGTLQGTLYPGTHFVVPLIHRVELFDIRDRVYATTAADAKDARDAAAALKVHSREGLPVGLGISVRYQLDPQRLPYIEGHLPQPVEAEILQPVVANAFRQTIANYLVRDVFSTRREEVRRLAAETITRSLAIDGCATSAFPANTRKGWKGCCSNRRRTIG